MMDPLAPLIEALAEAAGRGSDLRLTRLGTVVAVTAQAVVVQFDGETSASGRTYQRLTSYQPVEGDRVLLLRVGSTYVAAGAVTLPDVAVAAVDTGNTP